MNFSALDNQFKIRILCPKPTLGLVIGTYGSPAYIHLFLESAKRNFPIPILIHDDCSEKQYELKLLAEQYNCEFYSNKTRQGHGSGDLTAYCGGLSWAKRNNIDILVKMSRRFIPVIDWRPSLLNIALKSQHITYSNACEHFKFGIRTECVGMYVPEWIKHYDYLKNLVLTTTEVEKDFMELVKGFEKPTCLINESYIYSNANEYCQYYGVWDIIGNNRMEMDHGILWHDYCQPSAYLDQARKYGITNYNMKDFLL